MRIAMLCSGHEVTDGRVTFKEAASLAKAGHEIVVFGRESKIPFSVPRITLRALAPPRHGLRFRLAMMPKLVRAAVECRPDVVICHEPESALAGLWARRRIPVKVWFDVHEVFHESLASRLRWPLGVIVRALAIRVLRGIGKRVDWLTVVSPPSRRFYESCVKQGRIEMIVNSPRPEQFPLCRHDASGPLVLCHEGYLSTGRGLLQLLGAISEARKQVNVRLFLLGRIDEGDERLYAETIQRLAVADIIDGPRWVRHDELGPAMATAQVGLVTMQPTPNNYLSLSNKLFNYMACGMALIVPKNSATAQIVGEADCGIAVDTTRTSEITAAVVALARDPALRKRYGTNGRHAIEQVHGWHRMERRLCEIAEQLGRELHR